MSSFFAKFKDKKTGEIVEAFCIDDQFGKHRYGYQIGNTIPLREEVFFSKYDLIRDETKEQQK